MGNGSNLFATFAVLDWECYAFLFNVVVTKTAHDLRLTEGGGDFQILSPQSVLPVTLIWKEGVWRLFSSLGSIALLYYFVSANAKNLHNCTK